MQQFDAIHLRIITPVFLNSLYLTLSLVRAKSARVRVHPGHHDFRLSTYRAAMRPQPSSFSLSTALLLLPALVSAVTLDCKHLRIDGQSFDFSELGGPHSVHLIEDTPPSITNTTFTLDICNPLQRTKGVPKENECPSGTRGTSNMASSCRHTPSDICSSSMWH